MDAYDLQARHAPLVFAVTPVALALFALVPDLGQTKIVAGSLALIVVAALPFVATRIARSMGRARQEALFTAWGGPPTTVMLRFSDLRVNQITKRVYRERLTRLGASFPIPDQQEEQNDLASADMKIGAAMDEVRRRVKERGIKAVHRENINYGASRNAYGLKPFGLGACVLAILVLALAIAIRGDDRPSTVELAAGAAILVIAVIWVIGVTAGSVRQHAEAYALALFEAIEVVVDGTRQKKPRKSQQDAE